MKEVLYTPWKHLEGDSIIYVDEETLNKAKKFLVSNYLKTQSGHATIYHRDGCMIKDVNNLGLKFISEDETKIKDLASKLFPSKKEMQVG